MNAVTAGVAGKGLGQPAVFCLERRERLKSAVPWIHVEDHPVLRPRGYADVGLSPHSPPLTTLRLIGRGGRDAIYRARVLSHVLANRLMAGVLAPLVAGVLMAGMIALLWAIFRPTRTWLFG